VTDFRGEHSPKKDGSVGLLLKSGGEYLFNWPKHQLLHMAKIDPFKFLQEVRAEGEKVTWPTRKETTITTIMVFVMVFVASIFFLAADQIMRLGVGLLLGINT
jgi:preprotein translocase subunit SecE